jgi:hypothetical protein
MGIPHTRPHAQSSTIRALLIGSNRCDGDGFTGLGGAPVLALCRVLIEAGYDPHRSLHVCRGDVLCLTVRSIGEVARLTVKTAGKGCPVFTLAEGAAASLVRKTSRPLRGNTNLDRTSPEG